MSVKNRLDHLEEKLSPKEPPIIRVIWNEEELEQIKKDNPDVKVIEWPEAGKP